MRAISLASITTVEFAKVSLLLGYAISLVLPGYIFFTSRGGPSALVGMGGIATLQVLFPLFGLYAFIFVANQAVIGSNLDRLGRYFVNINHYHRRLGVFALLFAVLHPLAIAVGFGLDAYLARSFVSQGLRMWLLPGYLGLFLILLTAGTAIMNWKIKRISWWHKVHQLNYLLFISVWLHSWFIGSDVRYSTLRYVWLAYLIAIMIGFSSRYLQKET